ncbi:tRNA1(Val) (adenine(37)-N6)-methyltransferase [Clostridium ragsdalei P11]|uniref:tRNA1(Val) (Adenine(37)-N6)-methyltransferase n=1 Tax=Clostridium ragsdalei P11 TaxID=1353534 RepID=A0A1A6ANT8_9CLOT|nr:tRNA1(Val) (adenine(37)-N6)-methyltransferase [Clostridium ragsdalei]OBR91734.1 tRNA1(Val) (adenine(37)-N6)-methyltransferase [Clostridium ragsdalei P11]
MKLNLVRSDETLDDLQIDGICIIQKKNSFRFGVDAVLLANFAKIKPRMNIIDLCSGTGIVPFIIAGKTKAEHITGMEIQKSMVDMATRSVIFNGMEKRVEFIHRDLVDFEFLKKLPKVDVVTVNPPYKLKNSGITNAQYENAISRHEICCTLEDVIKAAKILLKDNGKLYMIHRPDRLVDIMCTMRKYNIEPKLMTMVQPCVNKAPNMVLIEGQSNGKPFLKWEAPICVHKLDGSYTDEIDRIYGRCLRR